MLFRSLAQLLHNELDLRSQRRPELRYGGAVESVTVRGVPELLLRALRNALDNAERHAINVVDASLRQVDDSAEVTVSNDGAAIAPGDRDRVFQPFVRLDESRSVDSGGTGLGLAIVADILRAHGGSAEFIDPPEGLSTTLCLRLPAAPRLNDWSPPTPNESHAELASPVDTSASAVE